MKPTVLAVVLATAVGVTWLTGACLVSTRSDALACKTQADCQSPRVCEGGYCVIDENACPSVCDGGCDLNASPPTCRITGSGGDSVTCPTGHHCDITCSGDACGSVSCTGAASCTINCTGTDACGNITCGAADCVITCSGTSACNAINCGVATTGSSNNGRCRVSCSGTDGCGNVSCSSACDCVIDGCTSPGDCGLLSCPKATGNTYCTPTGSNGMPCIDTVSGCSC